MFRTDSLKTYIFSWVTLLALGMALLLSYQGTRYFLKGLDVITISQMEDAAELLPEGDVAAQLQFDYHVAASWEAVPAEIRQRFDPAALQPGMLQSRFEDWWYFAPPERSFFLIALHNQQGALRYVSRYRIHHGPENHETHPPGIDPMVKIALWGLGAVVAYVAVLYRILQRLARPVQALYRWARALKLESLTPHRPDFQYRELNALADIIHHSLTDVSETLAREREFLGFASHELRTPIATLRSNATLLDKVNPHPSPKEREVRDRILRASLTMKGITETLLWLNRDAQLLIPSSHVEVDGLLRQIIAEQQYLLSGKAVEVSVELMPCRDNLPLEAFQILLTNIVRNAFQHTIRGAVHICQTAEVIEVRNTFVHTGSHLATSSQTGFGLGLKLTRKLVQRFEWELQEAQTEQENCVRLRFKNTPPA